MHVKGWIRTTLLDYPGRIAASLFCGGCNFRCPNCQNGRLVLHPEEHADISEDELWAFLESRVGFLDGLVISGGEPTLQGDLLPFVERARAMGYSVKLDTNGYRPDVLESLIDSGALDYVAMDVKAPLESYSLAAGVEVDVTRICRSIDLLREGRVAYEFRTTVVPGILAEGEIARIARLIAGAERYYLQQFVPQNTLDPDVMKRIPYSPRCIRGMAELARPWVGLVDLRGV